MATAQFQQSQVSRPPDAASRTRTAWASAPEREIAPVLVIAVAAAALVWFATPYGIGVSPDSTQYFSASQNLGSGAGLRAHWWEEGTQPFTHFPPGLPALISALTAVGLSPTAAAKTLNAAALIMTTLLTFALGRKAALGSTRAGLAAAAAVVWSSDVLNAHANAWSEPLFLALTLGALLALVHATERDGTASLVVAAALAGLAGMVRYAAPSIIAAGAVSVLLLGNMPWRKRLTRSLTFLVIAVLPLTLLLSVTKLRYSSAPREIVLHPPGLEYLQTAARTAYYWFMPTHAPVAVEIVLYFALAAAGVAFVLAVARSSRTTGRERRSPRNRTIEVLGLFCISYVAFLTVVNAIFDAQSMPHDRLLLPLVPALTVIVVSLLAYGARNDVTRGPALALGAVMSLALVTGTATWLEQSRRHGLGYNGPEWRQSRLIAAVRGLDSGTVVFSNHPGAILFHTGREVLGIPRLANPNSLEPNANYASRMAEICRLAHGRDIVYVHFEKSYSEWFLPSLAEARRLWRSEPLLVAPDGVIDTVPEGCSPSS